MRHSKVAKEVHLGDLSEFELANDSVHMLHIGRMAMNLFGWPIAFEHAFDVVRQKLSGFLDAFLISAVVNNTLCKGRRLRVDFGGGVTAPAVLAF